ncbi:MAG: agmatine deiminase family protein [Flavobacteriales bacterium]|nr:agmatine deiminase family protein [Flavobacteriales bacterium]
MRNTRSAFPILVACLFAACSAPRENPPEYVLPAEWEPHEAVWFTYGGNSPDTVLDKVALAMDKSVLLICAADNDSLARTIAARWESLGIARTRYRMEVLSDSLEAPTVRDGGPIFLRKRDGSLAVLDPEWNYYGDHTNMVGSSQTALAFEDTFPTMIARRLGLPVVHSNMVIEGGAVEVNGAGTLLQVEAVNMQRNPGWSKDSMEHELKRVFGVRAIIWLKEGPADDMWYLAPRIHGDVFNQGTGGHVDEFCRFVNDSTILLAWPDDADLADSVLAITRKRMEVNLRILERFRDRDGRALRVVKVPTPDTEFYKHRIDSLRDYDQRVLISYPDLHHGDTIRYIPAASYLNLLITNGRVFAPAYWHEGMPTSMKAKDERVRTILKGYFSDRTIVQVDPRAINWQGGRTLLDATTTAFAVMLGMPFFTA